MNKRTVLKRVMLFALIMALMPACGMAGSGPVDSVWADIENLIGAGGNIRYNNDPRYEGMVNVLLHLTQKTSFRGSLIVATDEDVIFASGTRLTDTDGNEVTPFTTYEIGSVTKSFTAVCIMKLIGEGRLSADTALGGLFPEYSAYPGFEKISGITVGDLLHMRSGLPDYMNAPDQFFGTGLVMELLNGQDPKSALYDEAFVNRLLALVEEDALFLNYLFSCETVGEPGIAYAYSNTDYRLLAVIIERVTGMSYEAYMCRTVFDPCGMGDSSAMSRNTVSASLGEGGWHMLNAATKGAGDIHSTAVDLLKYCRALFGGLLLSEDGMEALLTPVDAYACGWFTEGENVYHSGGTPGYASLVYVFRRGGKRLYVITLSDLYANRGIYVYKYLDKWF